MRLTIAVILAASVLSGCTTIDAMPMNSNTWQVSSESSGFLFTGRDRQEAMKYAANLTIQQGFERFVIVDAASDNGSVYIGNTRASATTSVYGNRAYTQFDGGEPMFTPTSAAHLVVRMFRPGDAGYEQALDARAVLAQLGG